MVFYHVVRCGSFCCVPQLGALFGGHLGTTPTSQRAAGEREAGYLRAEWALFGGSLGTLPTSPRAMGEREANYLETEWALLGGPSVRYRRPRVRRRDHCFCHGLFTMVQ